MGESVKDAVIRGANYLDARMPDWYKRIDTAKFHMLQSTRCILGQLYGTYAASVDAITDVDHHGYGFHVVEAKRGECEHWWLQAINNRLGAGTVDLSGLAWALGRANAPMLSIGDLHGMTGLTLVKYLIEKKITFGGPLA